MTPHEELFPVIVPRTHSTSQRLYRWAALLNVVSNQMFLADEAVLSNHVASAATDVLLAADEAHKRELRNGRG